jgi:hypothetical protein
MQHGAKSKMNYQELLANKPVLEPVLTDITGLKNPIQIYLFTMTEMQTVMVDFEDAEKTVRTRCMYFMCGLGADVSDESLAKMSDIFPSWQLLEIYRKALKLNGYGPGALGEAVKNSERTLN